MDSQSLEDRLEAWPEAWKEARLRLLDAQSRVESLDEGQSGYDGKMAVAKAMLSRESIELEYIEKLGQSLAMLVELRKSPGAETNHG